MSDRADEPVLRPEPIDPAAAQASYERLFAVLSDMMTTVEELNTRRCPYRDRTDHCTAEFGCRNQRRPDGRSGPRLCAGDEGIDHRSAWESR